MEKDKKFKFNHENVNDAIAAYKRNNLIITTLALIVIIMAGFACVKFYNLSQNNLWVVSENQAYRAVKMDNKTMRDPSEYKNHLKMFLFNVFAYDANNYKQRVETGLKLIDDTGGKLIIERFNAANIYQMLVETHAHQEVVVDKIEIDPRALPTSAYIEFRTIFNGPTGPIGEVYYKMGCNMRQVFRSDENPHGLIIENWKLQNVGKKDFVNQQPASIETPTTEPTEQPAQ